MTATTTVDGVNFISKSNSPGGGNILSELHVGFLWLLTGRASLLGVRVTFYRGQAVRLDREFSPAQRKRPIFACGA